MSLPVLNRIGTWDVYNNVPILTDGVGITGDCYQIDTSHASTTNGFYMVGRDLGSGMKTWISTFYVYYDGTIWQMTGSNAGGGGGGVSLVNTTAPISGGPITAIGTIGIAKANSLTDGYLAALDFAIFLAKQNAITTGTTSEYFRGDLSLATFPSIPAVGTWGALNYPTWVSGTPFVKMTATGVFSLDTNTYLTANQTITLSSEASGSGTTSISVTLSNAAIIAKVLTGYTSGAGVISSADTILQAIQKLNGNTAALVTGVSSVNSLTGSVALTGTANRITISIANVFDIASTYAGQTSLVTLGIVTTGTWHGDKIGLAYGGTNADLSGTGGTSNYLKQLSTGAAITVGTIPIADLPTTIQTGALIFNIDGLGGVIGTTAGFYIRPTYGGTITNWYMDADQNGTITITVKKNGVDMIGAGNAPALSSNNNQNAALASWTTSTFSAGDLITFGVISPATLTKLTCSLKVTKS